jgi:hypothetical protein
MVNFDALNVIAADDLVSHAIYVRDNDLLDKQEWKLFKKFAQQQKTMFCIANQAKPWSFQTPKRYMYGCEVPCNYYYADTVRIDADYENSRSTDTASLEIKQLYNYRMFRRLGCKALAPEV